MEHNNFYFKTNTVGWLTLLLFILITNNAHSQYTTIGDEIINRNPIFSGNKIYYSAQNTSGKVDGIGQSSKKIGVVGDLQTDALSHGQADINFSGPIKVKVDELKTAYGPDRDAVTRELVSHFSQNAHRMPSTLSMGTNQKTSWHGTIVADPATAPAPGIVADAQLSGEADIYFSSPADPLYGQPEVPDGYTITEYGATGATWLCQPSPRGGGINWNPNRILTNCYAGHTEPTAHTMVHAHVHANPIPLKVYGIQVKISGPALVCWGDDPIYDANPFPSSGGTYLWQNGATTSTISFPIKKDTILWVKMTIGGITYSDTFRVKMKCSACTGTVPLRTPPLITSNLQHLPGWPPSSRYVVEANKNTIVRSRFSFFGVVPQVLNCIDSIIIKNSDFWVRKTEHVVYTNGIKINSLDVFIDFEAYEDSMVAYTFWSYPTQVYFDVYVYYKDGTTDTIHQYIPIQ